MSGHSPIRDDERTRRANLVEIGREEHPRLRLRGSRYGESIGRGAVTAPCDKRDYTAKRSTAKMEPGSG